MPVAIDGHAGGRVAVMVVVMGVMLAGVALVVALWYCWYVNANPPHIDPELNLAALTLPNPLRERV